MQTADVVIVGAGVNGASTAFHLAQAGAGRVVVVERRHVAAGASGKSGALVRTHYTNEPETRLARESLSYFQHWDDMVGGSCGFQPVGLLVFAPPDYEHHLERNIAMQRDVGVDAQLITGAEARELDPSLEVGDETPVAYEPQSGFADPNATTYGFARAAMTRGVEFQLETEVTRVLTANGRVTGVETTRGTIEAPTVVVIAGAWANALLTPLGIDLGLTPILARIVIFRWALERSPKHLTYIDHASGSWARPIDGTCTLFGTGIDPVGDPADSPDHVSQDYIELCRAELVKRWPVMRHAPVRGNWAGILMGSPDSRPIIDHFPQYQGLFAMTGDSGTSFKTSPAIGKCLAEWITAGQASTVDLTPFRSTRFAEGKPWRDEFDYGQDRASIGR